MRSIGVMKLIINHTYRWHDIFPNIRSEGDRICDRYDVPDKAIMWIRRVLLSTGSNNE